jgi:hypothetical protein
LSAIDAQDGTRKITEKCGTAFAQRVTGGDLKDVGRGPIQSVGKEFPATGVAGGSQNGWGAPCGLGGMAFCICACGPSEIAAAGRKEGRAIAGAKFEFAVRIAGKLGAYRGERNGLHKLARRIDTENGELGLTEREQGHAAFAIPERGGVKDAVGALVDELMLDANRSDRKIGGLKGGARKSEETDFFFFGEEHACGKNELGGSFGEADAEKCSGGIVGQGKMMILDFFAKGFLPGFAGVGREIGVLEKLEAKRAAEIGDVGDAFSELTDGIVEGGGVCG